MKRTNNILWIFLIVIAIGSISCSVGMLHRSKTITSSPRNITAKLIMPDEVVIHEDETSEDVGDLVKFPVEPIYLAEPTLEPTPESTITPTLEPISTENPTPIPTEKPVKESKSKSSDKLLGSDFILTHYCNCAKCCGRAGQPTASGRMPQVGITVGVDPKLIKLGSYLRIEIPDGKGGYKVYRAKARADDTGGAVKNHKIDIYVGGHAEALSLGVIRKAKVYLIGE